MKIRKIKRKGRKNKKMKDREEKLRNNKGITLVALVVTIIVLIILAGISINLILGDNGIITKAKEASKAQQIAEVKEQLQMKILAKETQKISRGENKTKTELEAILSEYGTINYEADGTTIKSITTEKGHEIKISDIWNGELANEGPVTPEEPITYTAYTRGQEVTKGTETFYVLEDSDETKDTVTLFAKYNLNTAATAQAPNAKYVDTGCAFSSDNYWKDEDLDVIINLNEYDAVIEDTGSAVYKAKSYARTIFGENAEVEGRLLTYEEADVLKTAITTDTTGKIAEMLWGTANTQDDGNYLLYWLGENAGEAMVCTAWGNQPSLNFDDYDCNDYSGVRPVIVVPKTVFLSE